MYVAVTAAVGDLAILCLFFTRGEYRNTSCDSLNDLISLTLIGSIWTYPARTSLEFFTLAL